MFMNINIYVFFYILSNNYFIFIIYGNIGHQPSSCLPYRGGWGLCGGYRGGTPPQDTPLLRPLVCPFHLDLQIRNRKCMKKLSLSRYTWKNKFKLEKKITLEKINYTWKKNYTWKNKKYYTWKKKIYI